MANNAILGAMLILIKSKADTSGLTKTDKALRKTGGAIKSISKDIGLIGKLSKGFLGYLGLRGVGDVFNKYLQFEKDLGAMKSRFYAITKDDKLANEEFDFISEVATKTANSIKAVADSYSIFYAAAKRPLGQGPAREVFESWTKISRVLHLNEAQFERVTYALREMSSKGQLYSQDLKIQLGTHVPDAVNIAQEAIKSLGIKGVETVEEFQKLTKKDPRGGWMPKFLVAFTKEANRRYGSEEALQKALQQPDSLASSIVPVMAEKFLVEFSRRGGNQAIIDILTGVRNALLQIDFKLWAEIAGNLAKGIGIVAKYLPQIFWVLQKIATFLIMSYIFKGFTKLSVSLATGIPMFFKVIKGFSQTTPLITKIFYSLGRAFPALSKIAFFIAGQGFKGIVKGVLTGALGISGPIGWIAGSLMWLPEIFSIMKWIAKKLGWNDKSKYVGEYIGDSGIKTTTALNVVKKLNEKGIQSGPELDRQLGYYGVKGLAKYIAWDSHDQIVIRLDNGEYIDENELASLIARKVDATNMDENKPKTPRPIISKKGAWGRGY